MLQIQALSKEEDVFLSVIDDVRGMLDGLSLECFFCMCIHLISLIYFL